MPPATQKQLFYFLNHWNEEREVKESKFGEVKNLIFRSNLNNYPQKTDGAEERARADRPHVSPIIRHKGPRTEPELLQWNSQESDPINYRILDWYSIQLGTLSGGKAQKPEQRNLHINFNKNHSKVLR